MRRSATQGIGEEEYDLSGSHLKFKEPSGMQKFVTSLKLLRARPWRRFKKGSVLVFKVCFLSQHETPQVPNNVITFPVSHKCIILN